MLEYAKSMTEISVPRGFHTHVKEIDDKVLSQVVSVNGKIGWIGGNGRPDLAAGHSIIAGQYKLRSPDLVSQCNQCVRQAKDHEVRLRVHHIPLDDIRFVTFVDSSFDQSGVRHQQGWIVGFTNQYLNANRPAPVTVARWKSRKLFRKAGSLQAVETRAASYGCADTNWVRIMFYSLAYVDYDILSMRPRHWGPVVK